MRGSDKVFICHRNERNTPTTFGGPPSPQSPLSFFNIEHGPLDSLLFPHDCESLWRSISCSKKKRKRLSQGWPTLSSRNWFWGRKLNFAWTSTSSSTMTTTTMRKVENSDKEIGVHDEMGTPSIHLFIHPSIHFQGRDWTWNVQKMERPKACERLTTKPWHVLSRANHPTFSMEPSVLSSRYKP